MLPIVIYNHYKYMFRPPVIRLCGGFIKISYILLVSLMVVVGFGGCEEKRKEKGE
jgi:hypothetical protein